MGRASGEGGVTSPGGLSARLALRVYGFLCWALIPVLRWRLRRRARAERHPVRRYNNFQLAPAPLSRTALLAKSHHGVPGGTTHKEEIWSWRLI